MTIQNRKKGFVLLLNLLLIPLLFAGSAASEQDVIFSFNNSSLPRPFVELLEKEAEEAFPDVNAQSRFVELDIKGAFHTERKQYNAGEIIKLASKKYYKEITKKKFIIIVSEDIYSAGSDFVFGEANLGFNTAVVSTYRLGKWGQSLFFQRTKIEILHELGHLFGLDHCPDARCIMFQSKTLEDTDKKTVFCPIHNSKLKQNRYTKNQTSGGLK